MALLRWTPWKELETLDHGIGQLFDTRNSAMWTPTMDVHETDSEFLIQAELPGVEKKDVHVEVDHGVMTVSGERRYEKESDDGNAHHIERAYGKFMRSFSLPTNVDTEHVEANMKDGVLEVHLAKKEQDKTKTIEVS